MTTTLFRDRLVDRLHRDLIGPHKANELISDRPSQRYSTGILYPKQSPIEAHEDEDGGAVVNQREDKASNADEDGVSLFTALKPSVAGISFAVSPDGSARPTATFSISAAVYARIGVDDEGRPVEGKPASRAQERWQRRPLECQLTVGLEVGQSRFELTEKGVRGMELYVLVTPQSGLLTVTAALSNLRERGESSAYDEEQHFFQVELLAQVEAGGHFAPRPSLRAQTDDDTRLAALIYRDVQEYVVGHTCSAQAEISGDRLKSVRMEWLPSVSVDAVSDKGDPLFAKLSKLGTLRPLNAKWLSQATEAELSSSLSELKSIYDEWISREEGRIASLAAGLQPQARKHIARCRDGATRIDEGIQRIKGDAVVRRAFQLSQQSMDMQFGWSRGGAELEWRPFQLAFQLLVLASLENPAHPDRDVMDLLWFPTGGGKTEAYLGLTAFAIMIRRLREGSPREGAGVSVLMRYTLRLLTIQQFQRAAAMICACELLRRRSASNSGSPLGNDPIGIGLWVGGTATPLTLQDAVNKAPNDPSRVDQLALCPCCGGHLKWKISSSECHPECVSEPAKCELAATGPTLPVWTVDEEVYTRLPSLLIGTVDKFAQIVRKLETRRLFGRGTPHRPPELIIQDELHLISGPLGSIAGLYEVAIDELCRRGQVRPKIIGSTATIRRAEDQIAALFDRRAYQFPSPGLDASNSGFAVADRTIPGRRYVGVTTAGRSATYMLQALAACLLQAATDSSGSPEDRNYYWTLVAYFNSLRELGRALVLMQDDVPVSIRQFAARSGEPARAISAPAELTSRVPAFGIRDMLQQLSIPAGQPEAVDLLVASNMISVGMDIPRLGLMVVNSQPKTLAEYIQATSRVGRGKVPGLVVTMYNSMRARDRSHFETFETWHRCLYRDVEATSVTPFASRAQDKALHAVLVALVRHTVPGMDTQPKLGHRRADAERIAGIIEDRVARVDSPERATVAQKLKSLIDQWSDRNDLQAYWDDYGKRISLLMSAEQYAARSGTDGDLDSEGARRALWPTPNSMREVEAGTPFVLRSVLKTEDPANA